MKEQISRISEELHNLIQEKELEISDVIKDIPLIISMLEDGFIKLKNVVSDYDFQSKHEEIYFFKEIKPKLFSKLIFLRKIYQLELNKPVSNYTTIKIYLEREHDQINLFSNKNADFIQYYRSGKTTQDEFYFLRGRREMELNLESFYFERDPKFSTHFDFKVSKLLANDMLAAYLNCKLSKLKSQIESSDFILGFQSKEKWTDKKVALVEMIYAIHSEESVNTGNIELKTLTALFEKIFNIDLSDLYHIFLKIRGRKGDRTVYLNRLIKALNARMDKADSK